MPHEYPRNAEGLQRVYRYSSPSHYQLFATVKDRSISLEESKAGANFQIGGSREISESQFGYRERRSTQLATTLLVDEIRQSADCGKMVGALFLDLSKAFDTMSHDLILSKLREFGVASLEREWFADYLFGRLQLVQIGNQYSSPFSVTSGVPQGSILGPLLFLIFFNDLQNQLSETRCIQYADDTVIFVAHEDVKTIEKILNDELRKLQGYFRNNELVLNLKKGKTETVLFGTAKRLSKQIQNSLSVEIDGVPVHHVESYVYLENQLDSKLTLTRSLPQLFSWRAENCQRYKLGDTLTATAFWRVVQILQC